MYHNRCFIQGVSEESEDLAGRHLWPTLSRESGEESLILSTAYHLSILEQVPQMMWNAFLLYCVIVLGRTSH